MMVGLWWQLPEKNWWLKRYLNWRKSNTEENLKVKTYTKLTCSAIRPMRDENITLITTPDQRSCNCAFTNAIGSLRCWSRGRENQPSTGCHWVRLLLCLVVTYSPHFSNKRFTTNWSKEAYEKYWWFMYITICNIFFLTSERVRLGTTKQIKEKKSLTTAHRKNVISI